MRSRFGPFVLDSGSHELTRDAQRIHLTAKAMQLLEMLISRRPAVVSGQELYDHLWPDVTVAEGNLKNLVAEARRALGDRGRRGAFIRTAHQYGYAFVHPVVEESGPAAPMVSLVGEERRILLWPGENLVGRGDDCELVLEDSRVSRHHARLIVGTGPITVEDLQSKNGSFVNEIRLEAVSDLRDGDVVRFGPFSFHLRIGTPSSSTETFIGRRQ